jgi:hypothetical protein
MRELSLHILDIAENAAAAGATRVAIGVDESAAADRLSFTVEDDGAGLPDWKARRIEDPLAAAARRCDGTLEVARPAPGRGTRVTAVFRRSHIDRAPLGDMAATLTTLFAAYPSIDFVYTHRIDEKVFELTTRELREELAGLILTDPAVMLHVTESLRRALRELAGTASQES